MWDAADRQGNFTCCSGTVSHLLKNRGGLGIEDLKVFNKAFLGK